MVKTEEQINKIVDEEIIAIGKQKKKINVPIIITGLVILSIGVYISFMITKPWMYIIAGATIFTGLLFIIKGVNDKDDEFQIKLKK